MYCHWRSKLNFRLFLIARMALRKFAVKWRKNLRKEIFGIATSKFVKCTLLVFRIKRTSQKQFEMMVRLMEKNPDVASEIVPFGSTKKNRMELWEGIAAELNNIGFSIRSGSDWNKVWLYYKLKLKKKLNSERDCSQRWRALHLL
nr:uncharacterized protein LOC106625514 [Bactrocera oleae]